MAEKDKCPVCVNEESFSLHVNSSDGYASLISTGIGMVYLSVCSKCGCVYVDKRYLKEYKDLKERGFYG